MKNCTTGASRTMQLFTKSSGKDFVVPLFLSSCDTAPSVALHYDRAPILRNTFPIPTIISMPIQFADVHIYMTYVKISSNSTCKVELSQLHVTHSHHKPVKLPLSPIYQRRSTVGLQAPVDSTLSFPLTRVRVLRQLVTFPIPKRLLPRRQSHLPIFNPFNPF